MKRRKKSNRAESLCMCSVNHQRANPCSCELLVTSGWFSLEIIVTFFCICQFMIKYINNWVLLKLNESNYTLFTHQKFHPSFNRKINAVFSVKVSLNFLLLYFCVHNSSVIKTNNERAKKK